MIYAENICLRFTPNGDGINDYWTIYTPRENAIITHLVIYNKWGERVYERTDLPPSVPEQGWDGKFQDKKLNPGVFTFNLEVEFSDGWTVRRTGTVTLLR